MYEEKKELNESMKSKGQSAGMTDCLDRYVQRHIDKMDKIR